MPLGFPCCPCYWVLAALYERPFPGWLVPDVCWSCDHFCRHPGPPGDPSFAPTSLFNTVLMLVLLVGGLGLVARSLRAS